MRVVSLGSGSSGNALLVEAGPQGRTRILIDAGFPGRTLAERLRRVGVSPAQITAIMLTHEHSDHILGIPFMQKRHQVSIVANQHTLDAVERALSAFTEVPHIELDEDRDIAQNDMTAIQRLSSALPVGTSRHIGDIEVRSFPVSHDAVAPCGYLLSAGGCRVCVAVDSGEVTQTMLEAISQADLLVLK